MLVLSGDQLSRPLLGADIESVMDAWLESQFAIVLQVPACPVDFSVMLSSHHIHEYHSTPVLIFDHPFSIVTCWPGHSEIQCPDNDIVL